ncbi:MAG: hypothetical protein KME15_05425 [Drouetiella hepatica Uher 2000/2452]|jgi:hypothetical protein|uniref:Uncharacterized protein n=1 Tax=Drouetiella hepatica Uher 2000/2452 TaxID=904376 RepID=A0A951Q8A8_9CYAN|nr:hypothetical protein [Drouetiella hepatica Uher 2000/2452]
MWSVWFYTPNGERKFVDRFNTVRLSAHVEARNEAEAYRQRLGKLIGSPKNVVVCFEVV